MPHNEKSTNTAPHFFPVSNAVSMSSVLQYFFLGEILLTRVAAVDQRPEADECRSVAREMCRQPIVSLSDYSWVLARFEDGNNLGTIPDFWYPCALHAVGHEHAQPVLTFFAEVQQKIGMNRIWYRGFTGFE